MNGRYKLVGHKAVEVEDLLEWAKSFESSDRVVAKTKKDMVEISTVFLGLDHSFGQGPPLLFESMVFGGEDDGEMVRYSTWEEAETGHKLLVAKYLTKPVRKFSL
jgi:hypothetical protein